VLIEVDQDEFKPRSRRGKRAAPELVQRLEGGETAETAEELKARLDAAEERRNAEREKRRQRGLKDVQQVAERREAMRALEDQKAEELRKMIHSKTKVADNNRESAIDVVRIKKGGHHSHVRRAKEVSKTKPKVSGLGDLPPIGKGCLLAPEEPVATAAGAGAAAAEDTPKTSPHTPATLSGLVSPEPQSPKAPSTLASTASQPESAAPSASTEAPLQ
jgi:hypothetical protein